MSDNVLPFVRPGGQPTIDGAVDHRLSAELSGIYNILQLDHESAAVITNPTTPDYDPFYAPDGSMRLGDYGAEDFSARFAHTEVNPLSFYVSFMTLRHGLKSIMKEDESFHEELQTVAHMAIKRMPKFYKARDAHKVEAELLGQTAADIAITQQIGGHVAKNKQTHERVKIRLATEISRPSSGSKETIAERKRCLGLIALELPLEIRKAMDSVVLSTLKQRHEEAAS